MPKYSSLKILVFSCLIACLPLGKNSRGSYPDIQIAGAMKDVMWKGKLEGVIHMDSLENREGLYGLGPESYLTGEILVKDGITYVSRVESDTSMTVERNAEVSAPFFVYGRVQKWEKIPLPNQIEKIKELEAFINQKTTGWKRPLAFKLAGKVNRAIIHIQNLPPGTTVSSPQEAHQGQIDFPLSNEEVEIIGFFSTRHQGVFTHHDSYLHMHLITRDEMKMGHLDAAEFGEMVLFLPTE